MLNLKNVYPVQPSNQKQIFLKSCRIYVSLLKDVLPLGGLAICVASLLSLLRLGVGQGWGLHVSTLILLYIQYAAIMFTACQIIALLSNKSNSFKSIFNIFMLRLKDISYCFAFIAVCVYVMMLVFFLLNKYEAGVLLNLLSFVLMLALFAFYLMSYLTPFYACEEGEKWGASFWQVIRLSSFAWYRCIPLAFIWVILFMLLSSNTFIEVFPLASEIPFINVLLRIVTSFFIAPIFIMQTFLTINDLKLRMKKKNQDS